MFLPPSLWRGLHGTPRLIDVYGRLNSCLPTVGRLHSCLIVWSRVVRAVQVACLTGCLLIVVVAGRSGGGGLRPRCPVGPRNAEGCSEVLEPDRRRRHGSEG